MLLPVEARALQSLISIGVRSMASRGPVSESRKPPQKKRKLPPIKEPGEAGELDLGEGAHLIFLPNLFSAAEAAALMQQLEQSTSWEQREIKIMGKSVLQPRMIAYQADDSSLQYTYSGATLQPQPWSQAVLRVKAAVERQTGAPGFNSCLLNFYRSGSDHLSWHSDNEKLYGQEPTIASVSFGTPREFMLRRNADPTDKYRFWLGDGALLVMRGTVQQHWMHSVPKRKGVEGPRINLTFRRIVQKERQR